MGCRWKVAGRCRPAGRLGQSGGTYMYREARRCLRATANGSCRNSSLQNVHCGPCRQVRTSLLARQPTAAKTVGRGGRAPMLGSPVTSSDQNFANGVANLLTAPGATEALRITGTPREWEVSEGLHCCACGAAAQTRCSSGAASSCHGPWAPCLLLLGLLPPAVAATCVHMERAPAACGGHLVCRPKSRATSCATTPSRRA